MKIYRVGHRLPDAEHQGYEYFTVFNDAKKCLTKARKDSEGAVDAVDDFNIIDIPLNKAGVLLLLRSWASHPDNG